MNESFLLINKSNNSEKKADAIIKFSMQGNEYLVYSTQENEENSQIFVSRLVSNSEGKYFIDDLNPEEKNKLSNIVYNIVILMPTEAQKGASYESLAENLANKYETKVSMDMPKLESQDYQSNSSVAITSKLLVSNAIKFYQENLVSKVKEETSVPTWTIPSDNAPIPSVNVEPAGEVPAETPVDNNNAPSSEVQKNEDLPAVNPQLEKMAIVSDPSLTEIGVNVQPNVQANAYTKKRVKSGFAINKYVIIGTVCLILAVVVVVTAYFLIKNMA